MNEFSTLLTDPDRAAVEAALEAAVTSAYAITTGTNAQATRMI